MAAKFWAMLDANAFEQKWIFKTATTTRVLSLLSNSMWTNDRLNKSPFLKGNGYKWRFKRTLMQIDKNMIVRFQCCNRCMRLIGGAYLYDIWHFFLYCMFVSLLFGVYRPTREFFTHTETLPLPVKGCKFWPMVGTHGHWAVRVL